MRVTAPAPVTFLPENLFALFSRPGRELTVRVVEVQGKTLTLETGGEKFQARIAGSLLPEDFHPVEMVRVRVVSSGPPMLLHILESERLPQAEVRLLQLLQDIQKELPTVVSRFPAFSEKPELRPLVSFLLKWLEEGREKTEESPRGEDKSRGERLPGQILHNKGFLLPLAFADGRSWGFLEAGEEVPTEGSGPRFLYLRLFLSELGLVEAFLGWQGVSKLLVRFYFSREEALELARRELPELRRELSERGFYAEITLERSEYEPGIILMREG